LQSFRDNAGRAGVLTEEILADSQLRTYEERIARPESVSPADIQTLACRLFAGKHVAVVKMYDRSTSCVS